MKVLKVDLDTVKLRTKKTCNLFWDIHPRTGSKSGCCRLRKVVAESREWFYFFRQSIYMLRVLPTQDKLVCSKWRKSLVWRDSLSNQKSEPTQLAAYQPLSQFYINSNYLWLFFIIYLLRYIFIFIFFFILILFFLWRIFELLHGGQKNIFLTDFSAQNYSDGCA